MPSRRRPRSRSRSRALSSSSLRLRLAAILVTIAAAGAFAVLAACPPARRGAAPAAPAPTPPAAASPAPAVTPAPAAPVTPPPPAPLAALNPGMPAPIHPEPAGKLAVIIDDAGYSLTELQPFLEISGPLTIAVLPNLPHSAEAARRVLAAGKDLILHCPMEAEGGQNPGPGAIMTGMSPRQIEHLLDEAFASVPGAVGMNNHMGSRATADPAVMTVVLRYLKRHGKFFVDSRTTPNTVGPRIALELGVPFLQRNVFIDDERTPEEIGRYFRTGVEEARSRGSAVVIGHVQTPAVVDILRGEEGSLSGQDVRLARLQEIMKEQAVASAQ